MRLGRTGSVVAAALALAVALGVGLGGCGSSDDGGSSKPKPKPSATTVEIDALNQSESLSVHVGDIVDVVLPANPSTGYQWTVDLDEDGVVSTAGEPSFKAASDAVGAPGNTTFPLKAEKAGVATAVFKEMAPGDDDGEPAHVYALYIDVVKGTSAARVKVDQDYISQTAMMNVGDTLKVTLQGASASTGDTWRVAQITSGALRQAGEAQVQEQGSQPGAPALTTFSFKGSAQGQATVVFQLRRAGDNAIVKTYAVTAEVIATKKPVTVLVNATTAEKGTVTQLMTGDTLKVKVKGKPSTGYGWSMQVSPEGALVQQGDAQFTPYDDVMGSLGEIVYTYAVKGTGSIVLDGAYHDQTSGSTGPVRQHTWKFQSEAQHKPSVVNALEKSAASLVPLHVGDKLQVHLHGQASSPYNWSIAALNAGVLKQVGKASYKAVDSSGNGIVTMTFQAVGPGGATPILMHTAPGKAPEQTFAFAAWVAKTARHKTYHAVAKSMPQSVQLRSGDTLEVKLPGNATTGYSWIDASPDNAVMVQDGEPTFSSDSDEEGAPGLFTLKWNAVGPGGELIMAEYVKAGDEGGVPEAVWAVWVTVKK